MTSTEVYVSTMQVQTAMPRLYLMAVTGALVLKDLNKFRNKLRKNADYASTLEKKKQPCTLKAIRKAKQEVLEELNEMCAAIQDPARHIFLREFVYDQFKDYLDLERDEESELTVKDIELGAKFMLNNYVEENRLWCRTAFDVGRTKGEIGRRERKRAYLHELVRKGFLDLAGYCIADEELNHLVYELLEKVRFCGDSIAASNIIFEITKIYRDKKLVKQINKVLTPICAYATGSRSYIDIVKRLAAKNLIDDKVFKYLCVNGMHLARSIVDLAKSDPEELEKIVNNQNEVTEMVAKQAPWLEIIQQLLSIASKLWPTDLTKISTALEELVLVIFPSMEGKIKEVAKMINPKAGMVVTKTEEMAEEAEEADENEVVNEFATQKRFEDYIPIVMSQMDQEALVSVVATPMLGLSNDLMSQYLLLEPVVVMRKYFTIALNVKFCQKVSNALVDQPIIKPHEEYVKDRQYYEKQAELITDTMYSIVNDSPFEFAQIIPCCHNASFVLQILQQNKSQISDEAKREMAGALFYGLIRDGYLMKAYECLVEIQEAGPFVCAALYVHMLEYLTKAMRGEYEFDEEITQDKLFDCCRQMILCFENSQKTQQQPGLLKYIIGMMCNLEMPEDEKENILKRLKAACTNLVIREQRGICMQWLSKLYDIQGMAEEAKEAQSEAKKMQKRFGNAITEQELKALKE